MPPISYQSPPNGLGEMAKANGASPQTKEHTEAALARNKMRLIEQHQLQSNGANNKPQESEVFLDTRTLGAHATNKQTSPDDEPIVIYDTHSNTSITQTARDQFAAALLRLQSSLEVSTQRLANIESKVDNLVRQQRQQSKQQNTGSTKANSWASLLSEGRLGTLLYLAWPVLIFVAMRALERRAVLKKLS